MADSPRRGASWSSNCFQTSSAFGFLFFIIRSRVGIRGVESRKLKEKRTQRTQGRSTEVTEENVGARFSTSQVRAIRTRDVGVQLLSRGKARAGEKYGAKRKRAKPRCSRRFTRESL